MTTVSSTSVAMSAATLPGGNSFEMDLKQLVASSNLIKISGYSKYMQILVMEYKLFRKRFISTFVHDPRQGNVKSL